MTRLISKCYTKCQDQRVGLHFPSPHLSPCKTMSCHTTPCKCERLDLGWVDNKPIRLLLLFFLSSTLFDNSMTAYEKRRRLRIHWTVNYDFTLDRPFWTMNDIFHDFSDPFPPSKIISNNCTSLT